MAAPNSVLRYIHGMIVPSGGNANSDTVLVKRFVADRDERAFSDLVSRYGSLVLHVCRRILGDGNDAEDAYQATFLVLARKADRVHSPELLASWLYAVARRVSLKARALRAEGFAWTWPRNARQFVSRIRATRSPAASC